MNAVLHEILETNTVFTSDGQALQLHSHIPQVECEIIQAWIAAHQPHKLLEIGLGYGVSSLFICDAIQGMRDVTYHIIDAFQSTEWRSVGTSNLNRAGFEDAYILHEEPSEICLPRMLDQGLTVDFALIDSWHTFDHALVDFFYVNRMLEVGGIVVFDDIQLPSIKKVTSHVATYDCYEPLPVPERFRQSVKAKARRILDIPEFRIVGFLKTAPDDRDWDWYREF